LEERLRRPVLRFFNSSSLTGEDLSLEAGFVAWRRGSSGWSRGADEDYARRVLR